MAGGGIKQNNIQIRGGADGATFIPSVDANGNLSWTNDKGYTNPETKNIKGAKGDKGDTGATGATGAKLVSQVLQGQDQYGGNIYLQTFSDGTTATFTAPKGEKGDSGGVTTDTALSFASENPVQNKVLAKKIEDCITLSILISSANTAITLSNLTGLTNVDWGDGTFDNLTSHTYAATGTYTCKCYGVTAIANSSNAAFISPANRLKGFWGSKSLTTIGNYAFYQCTNLDTLSIGDNVTLIGQNAFRQCTSLTYVELPPKIYSIYSYAFNQCSSLRGVKFQKNTGLTGSITFGDRCFQACSSLVDIELPKGTYSIGTMAFYGCNKIKTLTIPAFVVSIGMNAFGSMSAIERITFEGKTPPSLGAGGLGTNSNCKIYVPMEALATYKTATDYINYASRIFANATTAYVDTAVASAKIPNWYYFNSQWLTSHGNVYDPQTMIEDYVCQCRFCGAYIHHAENIVQTPTQITCPTCGQQSYLNTNGYTTSGGGGSSKHFWRDENNSVWVDYDDETPVQSPVIIDGLCPVCQQNGDTTLFDYDTAWFTDDCPVCSTHLMFGAVDGVEPNIYVDEP